ncbi:MAG: hypothetical protein ABSF29_16975, partial [Tepidisphaeraceae bacterium]
SLRRHDADQDLRVESVERRLDVVERFKVRIAAVCSGIAIVTGMTWRTVLDWARTKLTKH